jgi:hypothetical protein
MLTEEEATHMQVNSKAAISSNKWTITAFIIVIVRSSMGNGSWIVPPCGAMMPARAHFFDGYRNENPQNSMLQIELEAESWSDDAFGIDNDDATRQV